MNKKYPDYYAFDLDGTLAFSEEGHHYSHTEIGEPIPEMINIIKEYINSGKKVVIFTARYSHVPEEPEVLTAIENWCEKYIGKKLEVSNIKTPGLRELWDDRAVSVQRNKGQNVRFAAHGYFSYQPLRNA